MGRNKADVGRAIQELREVRRRLEAVAAWDIRRGGRESDEFLALNRRHLELEQQIPWWRRW